VPVVAPIFTGGAISGRVKSAKAVQQQALVAYTQAIQNAFREVDDALVDQQQTKPQLEALAREIDALRNYARLARLRYENGYASYIEVLDADTRLYNAELTHAQTQGALFQALVNLYKSLGGGWVVKADAMTVKNSNPSGTSK
jgi:multidrug efflux system outer membrane protein